MITRLELERCGATSFVSAAMMSPAAKVNDRSAKA